MKNACLTKWSGRHCFLEGGVIGVKMLNRNVVFAYV